MAISDKLTYLNTTKSLIRERLNNLGASISVSDTFRSYVNVLDNLYDYLPKVTGSGTSITLNNTKKGLMKLTVNPTAMTQFTTTGKNKLPNNATSQTIANVIYTINDDKSISLSGTANANSDLYLVGDASNYVDLGLPTGTYTLSGCSDGSLATYMLYAVQNRNGTLSYYQNIYGGTNISIQSGDTFRIFVRVISGQNVDGKKIFPMLESGSTATTYEPYTGGIPAPSPSFPEQIHVVTGDNNTINVVGKNLLDIQYCEQGSIDATTGNDTPAPYNARGTNYIAVKPNTNYTISANTNLTNLRLSEYNSSKIHIQRDVIASNSKLTITTTANTYFVRWSLNYNNSTELTQSILNNLELMFNLGSTALDYTPFANYEFPLDLGDIEYCKIGDYEDRFFKNIPSDVDYSSELDEGAWYLKKNIGKVVLNGSETISNPQSSRNGYKYFVIENLTSCKNTYSALGGYLCNKLIEISASNMYEVNSQQNLFSMYTTNIRLMVNGIDTKEALITFLTSNNLTLYYVLSTPTYTPITGDLATQLEELITLVQAYDEQTNISQSNIYDLPFSINASALLDLSTI